ncbi:hypothetical protein NLO85_21820 [Pseudomonas savastanoi]|uniref:Spore coat protein n=1 Tax=Pseudomonas savastanoi TaxID=29438 RepID=A0AAW5J9T8_PSESS|nr:hypothetical protein [Pseudomonas savastanoi]MCQ3023136.1 hypothetical protein [Pseudomonas savastanoi]
MPDLNQIIKNQQLLSETILKITDNYISEDPVVNELLLKIKESVVEQKKHVARLHNLSHLNAELTARPQPISSLASSIKRSIP